MIFSPVRLVMIFLMGVGTKLKTGWGENSGDAVIYEGNFARYSIAKTGDDEYVVTDSLSEQYGGDGVDTLINIERIQFADRTNLKIRDLSASWDTYKTIVGTDGDDTSFIDFTDDSADLNATDRDQSRFRLKAAQAMMSLLAA